MQGVNSLFYFLVLILSIMVHEVAHGLVAEQEGDPTARLLGRITLNPLKHIDWFGSILLPLLLILGNTGLVVGWAKPVPYNPNNMKRGNKSIARVAIAGIVVNLGIAIFFGLLIRGAMKLHITGQAVIDGASVIVLINIVLALFNAIPLAPLDGFRFFAAILPSRYAPFFRTVERYSLPLLILFVVLGWRVVAPLAFTLYTLLTGIAV
ncbi:MAG TPA: site-2 protease family protein [Candidatus Paceibacterota bacterium]|nr:site-2 protease family protein [Candidatus Paceibacterota bacterium]